MNLNLKPIYDSIHHMLVITKKKKSKLPTFNVVLLESLLPTGNNII